MLGHRSRRAARPFLNQTLGWAAAGSRKIRAAHPTSYTIEDTKMPRYLVRASTEHATVIDAATPEEAETIAHNMPYGDWDSNEESECEVEEMGPDDCCLGTTAGQAEPKPPLGLYVWDALNKVWRTATDKEWQGLGINQVYAAHDADGAVVTHGCTWHEALKAIRAAGCPCCHESGRPGFIFNAGAWMSCPQCNTQFVDP